MLVLLLSACAEEPFFFEDGTSFFRDTGATTTGAGSSATLDDDGMGVTVACSSRLDVDVSVFAPGVVLVRAGDQAESYVVGDPDETAEPPSIVVYSDVIAFRTDEISVLVDPDACTVQVLDPDDVALMSEEWGDAGDGELRATLEEGERIYGLGERTGGLDRRGGTYDCWNTDAYDAAEGGWAPDADPLYQCVPFYVSKRGAVATGVFTDVTPRSTWDVGATTTDVLAIDGDVDGFTQYVVAGPSFADVLDRYTGLTGRPPLPPRWALGFHQSRWGWSPDTEVTDVVDGFRSRDLPLDAVWLDIQHMDGFRSWTWDPDAFPDPAGLVSALDADGVRAVSIVDPAIAVDPDWDVYTTGADEGYFLEQDGAPWVGEVWPGDAVFPDFADAYTRAWWGQLPETDLGYGIAGFWLDMNEPSEFTEGTVPSELDAGIHTMAEVHNVYALLEARATFEGVSAAAPDNRPFLLTRAGYAGIQRYAFAWTGDAPSTWDTLGGTLPMLLGMGLSGESWVGSDVGGYSGGASAELYARWMGVGAFSPFFRAHLTDGAEDQYPWSFGQEVLDISRSHLDLRETLVPYWYSLAWDASHTGAPPLRPLVWAFPDDIEVEDLSDEALIGDRLLVAPVLEEGVDSRSVYLPDGRWYEWNTGVIFDGPATIDRADLPLAALPIFAREGAIVPTTDANAFADEDPTALTLNVWPATDVTTFTVYEDAGDGAGDYAATTWILQGTDTGATLSSARDGALTFDRMTRVRVRRVDAEPTEVRLDGVAMTQVDALPEDEGWYWDTADLSLWIVFADAGDVSLEMDYDPTVTDPAPPVAMPFRVTVPEGTSHDTEVSIASSADDWATFTPLEWVSDTMAEGTLTVPRGEYVYYKYTRGDWDTVEKWPGCVEASNRYELGSAAVKEDTVWGWRDGCE